MKLINWIKSKFNKAKTTITKGSYMEVDFEKLWATCEIDKDKVEQVKKVADLILKNKDKYTYVSEHTKLPWFLIAAIHFKEGNLDFKAVLHNGEKIVGTGKKTTLVPENRGPFKTWEEAAIDAITFDKKHFQDVSTIPKMLEAAERYNGMGYRKKGRLSLYVWSYTNHTNEKGRYVADRKWDSNSVSKSPGVAAIFKALGIK